MSDTTKTFLRHENSRTPEQKALMQKIEEDGVCPFCAEHFRNYHPKPIIKETGSWFLTENISPYTGTKQHFLFVYKPAHISFPHEMTKESRIELFDLVEFITQEYKLAGGSLFMRFGDTRYNGSSVEHLHAQLVVGTEEGPDAEALRVKLGWKQK